jgi:hypothetical protein
LDTIPKKDEPNSFRVLLISEGGSISVVRENEVTWSRDESLTEVAGSTFVDLPGLLSLEHDELGMCQYSTSYIV